ncbi:MAG: hypothetical protein KatS3mg126_0369 [Lysobacteraceae bacterium]|nr:MAG: hypothetical protein KatS3mg126_0369 [Xanthomonadaceae bacterium]
MPEPCHPGAARRRDGSPPERPPARRKAVPSDLRGPVRLRASHAPPPQLPLAHLLAIPGWLLAGAVLLGWHQQALLSTRWAPATVAIVHAFLLGVVGNAMLGALQQFLPVAAHADTRWMRRIGLPVAAAFQLGLGMLVTGFLTSPRLRATGACLVASALLAYLGAATHALARAPSGALQQRLRIALAALGTAVLFGLILALHPTGPSRVGHAAMADVHAMLALGGGVAGLLGAVAAVVMPMLAGLPAWPERALVRAWRAAGLLLASAVLARLTGWLDSAAAMLLAFQPLLWLALAVLVGLRRRRGRRRPGLALAWAVGSAAMPCVAALALLGATLPSPRALAIAAWLVPTVALPVLVQGMLLEIVPFLLWNRLVQARAPGSHLHLPGVDGLLPQGPKRRLAWLAGVVPTLLLAAIATARPILWHAAALALAAQSLALGLALWRCLHGSLRLAHRFGLRPFAWITPQQTGRAES